MHVPLSRLTSVLPVPAGGAFVVVPPGPNGVSVIPAERGSPLWTSDSCAWTSSKAKP
jgi:hypothetical protein